MKARIAVAIALVVGGCGRKSKARPDARVARDAGVADAAAADDPAWKALDGLPRARPRWSVRVPLVDANALAVDVHGPIVVDGVAVVAGSQIGVTGVDLAARAVRFQRPVRGQVPLPAVLDGDLLVVGECDDAHGAGVIGCYTVLDATVEAVIGGGPIVATRAVPWTGPTTLALRERTAYVGGLDDDRYRFEVPDPPRGEVRAERVERRSALAPPERPLVVVGDGDQQVDLWIRDDILELRYHQPDLMSDRSAVVDFAGAPGALAVDGARAVRGVRKVDGPALQPVVVHVDGLAIDDAGAAVPGIALLSAAHGARGSALAVRLDATLAHDYVAAYTADGVVAWVYPLPPPMSGSRTAPVGVAMADDAVVVFHDGQIVAALPLP